MGESAPGTTCHDFLNHALRWGKGLRARPRHDLRSCLYEPRTLEASAKEPPLVQTPKVQSAPERIEEKPQTESEARGMQGGSSSTQKGQKFWGRFGA